MPAPDSVAALLTATGVAIAFAVATAWLWNRVRSWWGWFDRAVAVLLSVTMALTVGAIAVNHVLNLFVAWPQVFGAKETAPQQGMTETVGEGHDSASRVIKFSLAGRVSGITLPAYAYLPPGYDSAVGQRTRYPVIEATDGFPGSPNGWLVSLEAERILDDEITHHRMAPTVVIFPTQVLDATRDSECIDAVDGAQFDTYLSTDLRETVGSMLRVRTDRAGWSIVGLSTGGFCAVNLALRHPQLYAAAASMSGYFTALTDNTTGDLYHADAHLRDLNSPLWRLRNLPVPPVAILAAVAEDDRSGYLAMQDLIGAVKPPAELTTIVLPQGGHTPNVWEALEPPVFDWLSDRMAGPQVSSVPGPVIAEPTHGPVTQRLLPKVTQRPLPKCPTPGPPCPPNH
jgi:hypothetical protein